MIVLGIETSCDETSISLVKNNGNYSQPLFEILNLETSSQIDTHKPFGGVVPNLARREHSRNLIPLLNKLCQNPEIKWQALENLDLENILLEFLPKEPELAENLKEYIKNKPQKPINIDYLAVTAGPGLEPALWTGINLARALSFIWQIPLIPVNHLAGHIISPLLKTKVENINWPILALVASGGHTDLILVKNNWLCQTLGSTRDDAVGEAFDKTARLLDLPYPGGPELSKLAAQGRKLKDNLPQIDLPRPMLKSGDLDFSFSGLKTAVMYILRDNQPLNQKFKMSLACEFEEAAIGVLIEKIKQAIEVYEIKTVIIGGGVTANVYLRDQLKLNLEQLDNNINLLLPEKDLATDNAAMIAATGSLLSEKITAIIAPEIIARGRWPLGENPKKPF